MTWDEVKKQYLGVERAILLIKIYMELGSFNKVAEKFGTDRNRICSSIINQRTELKLNYPQLYDEYRKFSKSNMGKAENRQEYVGEKGDWEEVKEKFKGVDRARFVMRECIVVGGLMNMETKYGIKATGLSGIVSTYKTQLEKDYPEEFIEYRNYGVKRKCRKPKENCLEKGKIFTPKVFEMLEKSIKYDDFLKFILDYETGTLTSEKLVKMATGQGIKIYDNIDGNVKLIRL